MTTATNALELRTSKFQDLNDQKRQRRNQPPLDKQERSALIDCYLESSTSTTL